MNLKEYLFYKKMTMAEFARTADLSETYISCLLRGKINPTAKTLRVIERATGGVVKPENVRAPTRMPPELQKEIDDKASYHGISNSFCGYAS